MAVWFIILYFIIGLIGCFSINKKQYLFFLRITGIVLFYIAATRSPGFDRDYLNYELLCKQYQYLEIIYIEPTFIFISFLVKTLFNENIVYLFIIYALIGVFLKLVAIKQLSNYYLFSILIYFSNFFLLHEMTQIRAGIAGGFLLLSIKSMYERKLNHFFLFCLLAISFHYSAVIMFPLYFLSPQKINTKGYAALIIGAYALHFLHVHLSSLLYIVPFPGLQFKLELYKSLADNDKDHKINVFAILHILRLLLCFLFLWKLDVIERANKYSVLLVKIYVLAICCMVLLADIPGFSIRTSELLGAVEIILIPSILDIVYEKRIAAILVFILGLVLLNTNLFYTKLFIFK